VGEGGLLWSWCSWQLAADCLLEAARSFASVGAAFWTAAKLRARLKRPKLASGAPLELALHLPFLLETVWPPADLESSPVESAK